MAYNGKPFFKIPRPLLLDGGVENKSISSLLQLTDKDSLFQLLDGGAVDQDVKLPALKNGRVYTIFNAGSTNSLFVKDIDGVAVVTLAVGDVALIVCDGASWYPILHVNNI